MVLTCKLSSNFSAFFSRVLTAFRIVVISIYVYTESAREQMAHFKLLKKQLRAVAIRYSIQPKSKSTRAGHLLLDCRRLVHLVRLDENILEKKNNNKEWIQFSMAFTRSHVFFRFCRHLWKEGKRCAPNLVKII